MRHALVPDQRIAALAERQRGVVGHQQSRVRLTTSAIHRRVRSGRLHALYRGVYAAGHRAYEQETRRPDYVVGAILAALCTS